MDFNPTISTKEIISAERIEFVSLICDYPQPFSMTKKYKSKIGFGIVLFLAIVIGTTSALMIIQHAWAGLVINIVVIGFIVYLFSTTYYLINDTHLIVKSGFLVNISMPIERIKMIEETTNPLSAPATSLDRIAIYYNETDSVIISPKEKTDFINHLIQINEKIEVILKKNKNKL